MAGDEQSSGHVVVCGVPWCEGAALLASLLHLLPLMDVREDVELPNSSIASNSPFTNTLRPFSRSRQ